MIMRSKESVRANCTYDEEKGHWVCNKCGGNILEIMQICSIWLKGTMGGDGKTERRSVMWCENCDKEPNWRGPPIQKTMGQMIVDDLF